MKRIVAAFAIGWVAAITPALAQTVPDGPPTARVAPAGHLSELPVPSGLPRLTLASPDGSAIHIFPSLNLASRFSRLGGDYFGGTPPLIYHAGGPIMPTVTIYNIFWIPAHLQDGSATTLSKAYRTLMNRLAADYPANGIANNSTQYYQQINSTTTYIRNVGGFGGTFVDTSPYPASGCTDTATPNNCITDKQIQAHIKKVVKARGWSGGLTNIFVLYTSSGEGSCFDSTNASCAYTDYCAYHGNIAGATPIIYANIPYGTTNNCQLGGIPSPNNFPEADAATTAASHEITESVTDPLLNAWYTSDGFEIGDLCAYDYGASDVGTFNTWDSGNANQMWNGHFYEVQTEFDNHAYAVAGSGCVQVGPYSLPPSTNANP